MIIPDFHGPLHQADFRPNMAEDDGNAPARDGPRTTGPRGMRGWAVDDGPRGPPR